MQVPYQRILIAIDLPGLSAFVAERTDSKESHAPDRESVEISAAGKLCHKVLQRVLEIQKATDAELHFVHCSQLQTYPVLEDSAVMGVPGIWNSYSHDHLQGIENQMSSLLVRVNELSESHFVLEKGRLYSKVLIGEPACEIGKYVKRNKIDLLVVGWHENSIWQKFLNSLTGHTGQNLLEQSDCDVLLVKVTN